MKQILNKLKGWKLPLLSIIGFLFAFFSVFNHSPNLKKEPYNTPPLTQFAQNISGVGVVEPKSEIISVSNEIPGVVREIHVKVGDNIKEGEPVFSLDQRDIDAQIKILEANLAAVEIQRQDSTAQFEIAKKVEDHRAISKDDFNKRKFSHQLSQARVNEVEAKLQQARITKERLTIKAPIDGQILKLDIRPGEFITDNHSEQSPVLMGDISVLHVRVEIDEESASAISPHALAKGFRRGDTENPFNLKFVRFEPYIRPKKNLVSLGQRVDTRVLQVIYALPPGLQEIFVGQQMDVFIEQSSEGENK